MQFFNIVKNLNCFKTLFLLVVVMVFTHYNPAHAGDMSCYSVYRGIYKNYFEKAYKHFLKTRNDLAAADFPDLPEKIHFKKEKYEVTDFLGLGEEGFVVRVKDSTGNYSLMKVFYSPMRGFLRQIWDYYRMNRSAAHPYSVTGVDFTRKVMQFKDIRGIPMNIVRKLLKAVDAPMSSIDFINSKVAMIGLSTYEQNVIYDIDRNVFVAIDPH